ncbi:MAG: carbohydrate kinase family protein [Erysipelotrichaceae bacterium]|nr:carbohydrate kinase family protein [Erysipelotrichaceae bacterium]MBR3694449.1 carbohydrate kinase family protein [Erysipelotrichales bacterium]
MGIVVIGATFVDIKGFPNDNYTPNGRNAGYVKYIHGGVSRNVVEDIANMELRPTFVGIVDDTPLGEAVLQKLANHKVNIKYMQKKPQGMGTWLAVFDSNGDVAGSISQRPILLPILEMLEEKGDEIISQCDSIVLEADIEKNLMKKVFQLAEKYNKKIFAIVSNMPLVTERRDFLQKYECFICNLQEAGVLFADDYSDYSAEALCDVLSKKVIAGNLKSMVVTMGDKGSVYADCKGNKGVCPARKVHVIDTTGAGDSFCAGVAVGLTYGKTLAEAVEIGTHLAATVITSKENVCPRFLPRELGLDIDVEE